jgi:Ni2+-binding GTPase involved in maturation of urease and hydrogenase
MISVAGPPSSGKSSVILKTAERLLREGFSVGAVKFDCISTRDDALYRKKGIPVLTGLAGNLCPDHYYVTNIHDCADWGIRRNFDFLISESAGLCNRCSPHIKGVLSVCVIDCLSGADTPGKIGPMLLYADIAAITKGDIVSQAEREVFAHRVRRASKKARVIFLNGLTGQGAFELADAAKEAPEVTSLAQARMRFTLPVALCSYCLGETRIGPDYQTGSTTVRKMEIPR